MNEADFAFRIRQALNEGADSVSYKASLRLQRARQLALSRARSGALVAPVTVRMPALQVAAAGGAPLDGPDGGSAWAWLRGAGLAAPLLALVVGFVGIHHWHSQQFISELADVDFAVLLDDTPIAAYADQSFGAMLARPDLLPAAEAPPAATSDAELAPAESSTSDSPEVSAPGAADTQQ
jgi:hypothetical protein